MKIYRVFRWNKNIKDVKSLGGPLYIPRIFQGKGRHDIKEDGILYASLTPVSTIAEDIKDFKNLTIENDDFKKSDDLIKVLVELHIKGKISLIDFTDPNQLLKFRINPAHISTHNREITQNISKKAYDAKADGFLWWSSLESTWINISLFESRIKNKIKIVGDIIALKTSLPEVKEAAGITGVRI